METQYYKSYSPALGRDMECKVYGHAGRPVLFIPCQDGRFFDFENFHMTDVWAPWIETGRVMVFAIDTLDRETWSDKGGDPYWRIRRYEQWIAYITDEMVPFMRAMASERNGWEGESGVLAFGCSLGATHAANLYLRRPDLFDRLLALSGIYTADYGFGGYMDEVVYQNSPVHYMANLPADHPYVEMYNRQKAVICAGQGPWEVPETTCRLRDIFAEKGIHIWVDLWGYDVAHDWDWWYKQVAYFLPYLLDT
ncbi:MAG: esterase family protein [Oscillospiraceae bacterium]